jgi:histidinol dehydrogenase
MTAPPTILEWSAADPAVRARIIGRNGLAAALGPAADTRSAIAELVADVRETGDEALIRALARFDGVQLSADELKVSEAEFAAAADSLSAGTVDAIRLSIRQVRLFNQTIVDRATWSAVIGDIEMGEVAAPIPSVGLFVPSGKGSFPSVLIQIATPAVVAGVPRIVVVVPPTPGTNGQVDPAVLVAAAELGITDVYRCNGPSGIAAMAFGTDTVPAVAKIVGPGSPAVAAAQLEVQQYGCLVEPGFGPTDSLIVADGQADPRLLAADLINEAEHGPDSSAVLLSADRAVLEAAATEVGRQLADLPEVRREYARTSIVDNGGIVHTDSDLQSMEIANDFAAEHLQLAVAEPRRWLPQVRYAGTVLLGQWTTMSASNFAIGTPATLPTTGYANRVSGVTAATFLVRSAVAELDEASFHRIAPAVAELARHEGFPAHLASVRIRGVASDGRER